MGRGWTAAVAVVLAVGGGCGGGGGAGGSDSGLSGEIRIDGSSTVAPLSETAAEFFEEDNRDVRVTVGTSGTGGGFEKFCNGEIDISDASRPIKDEEIAACKNEGIGYVELVVANDALSVVVNPDNDWASCLTVEELRAIWQEGSEVDRWSEVRKGFPDEPLELYGAGTDSGTFDYFTDVVNGEEGNSRTDYQATEDDNVTVQGVSGTKGALGYFGLSYALLNEDRVTAVEIDGGEGCVAPSAETVIDGSYQPLGRPLFIYVSTQSLARPEVRAFAEFYLATNAEIAETALFIPLSDDQLGEAEDALAAAAGPG